MLKAKTIKESNYDMEKCDDDEHIFVGVESYFEKKLVGDSRYDYTYYNGKNHMSSVSMLTRKNEKQEKVKVEAYYAQKKKVIKAKMKNMALVATRDKSNDDTYQIWASAR